MTTIGELVGSRRLVTIAPDEPVVDAVRRSASESVSHLLVMEDGRLLGVCCICDLDAAENGTSVRTCMNLHPVTIDADADAIEAVSLMTVRNVSCLPVMVLDELYGVITRHDLRSLGLLETGLERCSACGSTDHVRCIHGNQHVGLCLECARRSEPPEVDDELGGDG